jgi:hypothetical protein
VKRVAIAVAALSLLGIETAAANLTVRQVIAVAHAAGFPCGEPLALAVAIAVAESSLNPGSKHLHPEYGTRDDGNTHHDRGLWQVSTHWWPAYNDAKVFDPASAAVIAFEISEGGKDFTPWDSFDSGTAQRHLDEAFNGWPAIRPIVQDYCRQQA